MANRARVNRTSWSWCWRNSLAHDVADGVAEAAALLALCWLNELSGMDKEAADGLRRPDVAEVASSKLNRAAAWRTAKAATTAADGLVAF